MPSGFPTDFGRIVDFCIRKRICVNFRTNKYLVHLGFENMRDRKRFEMNLYPGVDYTNDVMTRLEDFVAKEEGCFRSA